MKFDNPIRIFVCDKCNDEFHTLKSYKSHKSLLYCEHEGKTIFECTKNVGEKAFDNTKTFIYDLPIKLKNTTLNDCKQNLITSANYISCGTKELFTTQAGLLLLLDITSFVCTVIH